MVEVSILEIVPCCELEIQMYESDRSPSPAPPHTGGGMSGMMPRSSLIEGPVSASSSSSLPPVVVPSSTEPVLDPPPVGVSVVPGGGEAAVVELQRAASQALEDRSYQQAVDYLQRAIKIEPRNPWSWYYLGQTYWRSGDNRRCLEMVERAFSYSGGDAKLEYVNQLLRQNCQQG